MRNNLVLPSNRQFGILFAGVFGAVAIWLQLNNNHMLAILAGLVSMSFVLASLFFEQLLLPLNRAWMRFGLLLSRIVSPIIFGFIFFFLFAPIGILMKLVGRDELRLKQSNRTSHWKNREDGAFSATDSYKNQF